MKFLFLDKTKQRAEVIIADEKGKIIKKESGAGRLVGLIKKILKNDEKISGIIVAAGPDTFSLSRGNVAAANTLSYSWNVPVTGLLRGEFKNEKEFVQNGLKKIKTAKRGGFVIPAYSKEPNITVK